MLTFRIIIQALSVYPAFGVRLAQNRSLQIGYLHHAQLPAFAPVMFGVSALIPLGTAILLIRQVLPVAAAQQVKTAQAEAV